MKGKRLKIRGNWWKLALERPPENNCDGYCDYNNRTIYVRPSCDDPVGTCVHECLHAALPDLEEEAITETEEAIVGALNGLSRFK